ncbi:MAG: IS110 family transposase [Acetobacteraceae bacterium]
MTSDAPIPTGFIGCDVGKAGIVVFDSRDNRTRTIANRPDDLATFAATLDEGCLTICEATGGHEAALLNALIAAKHAIHRADARKVKAFIRSFGTLGKTDTIDARALARYGQERHAQLARWQTPDLQRDRLQSMVLTRRDLVDQRVACKNRLASPGAEAVQPYLQRLLECLDAQIAAIEADTADLIKAHEPLNRATRSLCTLTGIGFVTAVSVIALMPELGSLNRRQAAALAGLVPHPRQSGATDGYRRTRGGRPEIKKVLFMAALTAAKRDPRMRAFHDRLVANGKKPIVAIVAVMRKLIVICNALLRPGPPRPEPAAP